MFFPRNVKSRLISLILSTAAVLYPLAAKSAERIMFEFPPFGQFAIAIEDLEAFVATGEISRELAFYLDRLSPQQVAKLPELLSTPLELDPLTISKFSNSSIGEAVIKNFGKGIRADINRNGFYALRGAIIAAAFDEGGLTVMNLLERFPLETIYLDAKVLSKYIARGATLANNREAIDAAFFNNSDAQKALSGNSVKPARRLNLENTGAYSWDKQVLAYNNPQRPKSGAFDLYLPEIKQAVPLIVISHGLASSRQTFAYLGEHFASHGFAVAVVEHDGTNLTKFDNFLAGTERFPEPNNLINQPLDVKYVLDRLERESQVNTQQVGVIGQSFGGYTALALAGGELTGDRTITECQSENYRDVILDLSSLAQCAFNQLDLPRLQSRDPRIKAVVAINPMGKIFGQTGMSSIEIPTMLVSGTNDLIMPPVAEQIRPFSWLEQSDKYLVLVKPATHFSFLQEGLGVLPVPDTVVGPNPSSAHPALKALSTAFFRVHLAQQPEYRAYLESDRIEQADYDSFELSIIRQLTPAQLQEIIER